ncbi:MAG: hypothetical protein F4Z93_05750, partial [Rhodospirillales bacterium]|nr:hypothetical protein [Rhodospirillales bacterium]
MAGPGVNEQLQYEPQEPCSPLLALGVGLQGVMLVLAPTVLIVAVSVKSAGQDDDYLTWALFAMLIINAVITAMQARRIGRVGAGYMVITGPTVQFVVVVAAAISEGGPELLASLMVASSLLQFALAAWLPIVRRIITPVVSGVVLMLVAATVLPVAVEQVRQVQEGVSPVVGPSGARFTLAAAVVLSVRGPLSWRPWSPLISIAAGCVLTALLGAYEVQRVIDAPWFGVPEPRFPGFDLTPGVEFWALLPTFAILTLVLGIKVISDTMVVQQASFREPRAIDFRHVQGGINANSIGMVLA